MEAKAEKTRVEKTKKEEKKRKQEEKKQKKKKERKRKEKTKKEKTIKVKKIAEEWEICNNDEKAAELEEEAKKLVFPSSTSRFISLRRKQVKEC